MKKAKSKHISVGYVSAWVFSILSILGEIGSFSILSILGGAGSIFQTILGGSFMIIAGLIILPPLKKRIPFSTKPSLILFLILVCVGIFLISRSEIYISVGESPTKTAEEFARAIEQKDYVKMYGLFVPELQESRSLHDFVLFMSSSDLLENFQTVRLDKVSLEGDDVAYAYFTVSAVFVKTELPALTMKKVKGEWRFNAFASAFTEDCPIDCPKATACSTYRCDNSTGFLCKPQDIPDCITCSHWQDCPSHKPWCLSGMCSKECLENKHCANNYFGKNTCDTRTGSCVQCLEDKDCYSNICDKSKKVCLQCNTDADCANEPYQKTCYEHRCVECVDNDDCSGSRFCDERDLCIVPK